jgi:hypothetical protein
MKSLIKNTLSFCALVALTMMACRKETVAAEYFFTGQLAGAPLSFEIGNDPNIQMVTSNEASLNAPNCRFDYDCGIGSNFGEPTEKSVSVTFPSMFNGKCSNQATTFPSLFAKRIFKYGDVMVTYFDGTDSWTSNPLQQNGNTFEITESEVVKVGFSTTQKVGGKFSCILYNRQGVSKKLDGATFTLSFEPWPL